LTGEVLDQIARFGPWDDRSSTTTTLNPAGGAMKAIVVSQPNQISFAEVESPSPGSDDVLIRSRLAGLCRTDTEILSGAVPSSWVRYPCIPGHEWSGEVAATGDNVTDFSPGDRVVSEGMIPCNRCSPCRRGETNLCANYDQIGFTRSGGCGEYVVAPRHVVHALPDSVSFESGVLVEPASCVLRLVDRLRPRPGDAIGVIGVGTLGSIAIQLAKLCGPRAIVAYGLRDEELRFARNNGATHTINVATMKAEKSTIREFDEGLDVVIETAGAPEAVRTALELVRAGGRVGLLGIAGGDRRLEIPSDVFVFKDTTVAGALSYTSRIWSEMMRLLAAGLVDFDSIVTHRFAARDFADAYSLMDNRSGLVAKIVLEHGAP
jgi:L-iditol 2-dehydrogenase